MRSREGRPGGRTSTERSSGPSSSSPTSTTAPGRRALTDRYIQRKAKGDAAPPAADQAVDPAGAGQPLPDASRASAERSLGVELGDVRVHTDDSAAASAQSLDARAYTAGSDIYFNEGQYNPGSAEGDRLMAHELVHVAQQDGAAPAPQREALGVSRVDEPAEREADRGADAILSGSPFAVHEQPTGIPREALGSDPRPLTDSTGAATTTHRAPGVADASNAPAAGPPATESRPANVRVIAPATAPLRNEGGMTPVPTALYEEGEQVSPPPSGYTPVTEFRGSVTAPILEQVASPDIFIGGQPSTQDVEQAGIGDCFFLATLISVANRDPGKIRTLITPDGRGGGTVNLWRRETVVPPPPPPGAPAGPPPAATYNYVPVAVAVSADLNVRIADGRVHGAQLRCAEQPRSQEHWAAISGSTLEVHRKDLYDCARWAPLVEKGYARFSEAHGQYGGMQAGNGGAGTTTSGYDNINGGVAEYAMLAIYGAAADAPGATQHQDITAFAPAGSNILAANAPVVDQLILLEGRGPTAAPGDTNAPILMANVYPDETVTNLGQAITAAIADPDWATIGADRQTKVLAVQTAINAWAALPPDPAPPAAQPKQVARDAVATAAIEATRHPNPDHLAETRAHNPSPIQFEDDSDAVPADKTGSLRFLGQWLEYVINVGTLVPFNVSIVGHASSTGEPAHNQTLSEGRATHVKTAIETGGTPANLSKHTITASGVGAAGAGPEDTWRRVDITIDHQQPPNELFAAGRSPAIRAMMDLMLNTRNLGTDASGGQRNVYAGHSYSVVSVTFVDAAGQPVNLRNASGAARTALFPTVDVAASRVTLQNPHHGNEPDRLGTGAATRPEDGAPSGVSSDGVFQMDLNEFFRNFNSVQSGVFPRTP